MQVSYPDFVQDKLNKFIDLIINEGKFFDDKNEFPDDESVEIGKVRLWNLLGEDMLQKHFKDPESYSMTPEDLEKLLTQVIVETNLELLMKDNLIDGIENENGEMVYWLTEKGKEVHKFLNPNEIPPENC